MKTVLTLLAMALASPGLADEAEEAFVEANLIGIFYHELGHALIDIMQMPVFGQEEDAADVASILLVDNLFEEETALALAYDVADGFWAEAEARDKEGYDIAFWDVHGPDEQRFYNTVCLFYGGNPEARLDYARDMDLPEERADFCADEHDLAMSSWGPVFEEMTSGSGARLSVSKVPASGVIGRVIAAEVDALNDVFSVPQNLSVAVEVCGEANAFYDPDAREIVMCTEFEGHLRELFHLLGK